MLEIAWEEIKKNAPEWLVLNGGFLNVLDKSNEVLNAAVLPVVIKSGTTFSHFTITPCSSNMRGNSTSFNLTRPASRCYERNGALSDGRRGGNPGADAVPQADLHLGKGGIGYNWYNLRNKGYDPKNYEHNFGMLTMDFYPKPVYAVYNSLSNLYRGGKFRREVRIGNGLYGFLFQGRDGSQLLAAWGGTRDREPHPLVVSGIAGKAEVVDLYGNAQALPMARGIANFEVGAEPLTLRVTGQNGEIKVAGALVRPVGKLKIEPGKEAVFTFELCNPEKQERSYRIHLTLPAGLSTDAKPEILLLRRKRSRSASRCGRRRISTRGPARRKK